MLFTVQAMFAQRTITGIVTNADDGSDIPGVSVRVKGTAIGTVTDLNGKYALSVPDDALTLVFSFVGMVTQEVAISGRTVINVVMQPEVLDTKVFCYSAGSAVKVNLSVMQFSQLIIGMASVRKRKLISSPR